MSEPIDQNKEPPNSAELPRPPEPPILVLPPNEVESDVSDELIMTNRQKF